jgi:GNAT superfamily N-acetyltransferase
VEGADVLASATQYDLAAVLDQRPMRVCGIGSIFSEPAHRDGGHARLLVERLLDQAARDGAAMALLFSDGSPEYCQPNGFEVVSTTEVELSVAESAAYVVVSIIGSTWTIEECGDRDPSGARVGAILQALIAREPVERSPTIRAGSLAASYLRKSRLCRRSPRQKC